MKRIRYTFTIVLLLCCSKVLAKTEYFGHIMFQETPYTPFKGIHPLSEQEAHKRVHYRFTYNDQHQVKTIRSYSGKHAARYYGSFDTYYWVAAGVSIDYEVGKETHYFLNVQGEKIHSPHLPHHGIYTLDENGLRVGLRYFSADNEAQNNHLGIHRYEWRHEKNGVVIENRFDKKGNFVQLRPDFDFKQVRFTFDKQQNVQFMHNYSTDGNPLNNSTGAGIDRIFYDHQGNFMRWQVYDKDGNPVEGNGPNVHIGEYLYNQHGDKLVARFFDRYGKPMLSSNGLHRAVNRYNNIGIFTQESQFDVDGKITQVHQREFSPQGTHVIWDRFFDGEMQPRINPYFGGAAAVNYLYNEHGNLKERVHYDAALKFFDPFNQ